MQHPFDSNFTGPRPPEHVQEEEPSKLKLAIDTALEHAHMLRLALKPQAGQDLSAPQQHVRATANAETQTEHTEDDEPPCSSWPLAAVHPTFTAVNPTFSAINPTFTAINPTFSAINSTFSAINPTFSAINPTFSATNSPQGKGALRGPALRSGLSTCRTPLPGGAVGAAVHQACIDLLTPHGRMVLYGQASAADSPIAWRITTGQAPSDSEQSSGTGASSSPNITPQPTRTTALASHQLLATPMSDISLAAPPRSQLRRQQQQRQRPLRQVTDVGDSPHRHTAPAQAAALPELLPSSAGSSGQPLQQAGAEAPAHNQRPDFSACHPLYDKQMYCTQRAHCTLEPSPRGDVVQAATDSVGAAVQAPVAGTLAAAEQFEAFTPNTTALRLRAAVQWMRLQLQESVCRVPRLRRFSDSAVSPARRILDGGMEQPDAGPDAGCSGVEEGHAAKAPGGLPLPLPLTVTDTNSPKLKQPAQPQQLPQQQREQQQEQQQQREQAEPYNRTHVCAQGMEEGGPVATAVTALQCRTQALPPVLLQPADLEVTTPVSKPLFLGGGFGDSVCEDGGLSPGDQSGGTPLALPSGVPFAAGLRPLQDSNTTRKSPAAAAAGGGKASGGKGSGSKGPSRAAWRT